MVPDEDDALKFPNPNLPPAPSDARQPDFLLPTFSSTHGDRRAVERGR